MPSGLETLRNDIKKIRNRNYEGRYYIDPKALNALCEKSIVEEAIEDCQFPPHKRAGIKHAIVTNGHITFCILVLKARERFLTNFLDQDIHSALDHKLPLDETELKTISEEAADDFFEAQWEFRPVILGRDRYHRIVGDLHILPFDKNEHAQEQDGSYGAIHKVVVKSSMQNFVETRVSRCHDHLNLI